MARLRKQGVVLMERAYPLPHEVGKRWIGPKGRDGEGDFLAQRQARPKQLNRPLSVRFADTSPPLCGARIVVTPRTR